MGEASGSPYASSRLLSLSAAPPFCGPYTRSSPRRSTEWLRPVILQLERLSLPLVLTFYPDIQHLAAATI